MAETCPQCGEGFESAAGLAGHVGAAHDPGRRDRWDRVHAAYEPGNRNQHGRKGPSLRELALREGVSVETIRKVLASPRP